MILVDSLSTLILGKIKRNCENSVQVIWINKPIKVQVQYKAVLEVMSLGFHFLLPASST